MVQDTLGSTARGWLAKIAGIAVAYFALGKLTLLLAIPPGYATAVWPAAGIALAGTLLFGYRVWPGVFVGSFLVNVSTSFDPTGLATVLESIALSAAIGGGASLQAVVGAFLVRRFVGFPSSFDRLDRILATMAYGGPLACSISATVGVASLLLAGSIEGAAIAHSWGTWWLGDTIGVLVVMPLASAWGLELHRAGRRTRLFVSLPVLIAMAMTVLGYLDARGSELRRAQADFERRAEIMGRTLEQTVLSELEILQSIVSLLEIGGEVDHVDFRVFVEPVFARHPDLHGLSWNSVVSGEDRAAVEEKVRREGFSEFLITEQNAEGEILPAAARDEYVVVTYIEPYQGNEQALGYDLASNPDRARALAKARDTGEVTATPPIILVQETEQKPGFLFLAPVYRGGLPNESLDQRRRNLHSFVSGVFRAEPMVEEALRAFGGERVDYEISDTSDPEDTRLLYGYRTSNDDPAGVAGELTWSTDFEIAGRRWTVRFRPAPGYASVAQWGKVWVMLTGGLFFTSLLGAFLLVVAGRESAVERANEGLQREINERLRVEEALIASEEQFRAVFENAAVGVAIVDADERLVASNEALQRMLGYSGEELQAMRFSEFTHPEDIEADVRQFHELMSGSRFSYAMEKRYITKSGKVVWGHLTVSQGSDPDGEALFTIGINQDITARKVAEETLERSQIQLVEAQRIAQFGSWEWDLHTDRASLSDEAYRIFGVEYEDHDATFAGFLEYVHPDDSERMRQTVEDAVAGKKPYDAVFRIVRPDGAVRFCHTVAEVERDQDGSATVMRGTFHDITERKQAEETAARFSRVLESSLNEIYAFDAETLRFVEVNLGARGNLGYSIEELRGLTPLDLKPEFTPDSFAALIEPLRSGSLEKIEFTTVHRRKDGTQYPVEVHLQLMKETDAVFVAIILDITERRTNEQALLYTQFSVDNAVDGILRVEHDGKFSYVNEAACEMSGFPRETLLTMSVFDIDPNFSMEMWPEFWQAVQSTDSQVIESQMRRKDGSILPVEIALNFLEVGGVGRLNASVRDMAERKEAEEERLKLETKVQEAQKLESLGVLAGGIAHDFNNLLVGVLGNAELAMAKLAPTTPAREYLLDIEASAERAADLANQLLAYSGKGKFVVEPIDLSDLVDEIAHLVEVAVSKKAVVKYELERGLPALECDATQVRQVVLNLITNASEAIDEGVGVISITTGKMECDATYLADTFFAEGLREGTYVFVEVADTGSGMDEETQQKIFDPFFTTKFTGRGLGLAAALGIVRGHDGAIKVCSEPGRGTTIKVLFPASERAVPKPQVPEAGEATWQGEGTVLLVDDEELVRSVGSRMLTLMGFDVITALDGVEALEIYRKRTDDITLVLLDLAMPRMGGEETFSELRRVNEDVKVILSSGYNEQDSTSKFAGKGLAGFIQKPYRLDSLRQKIREVLDG